MCEKPTASIRALLTSGLLLLTAGCSPKTRGATAPLLLEVQVAEVQQRAATAQIGALLVPQRALRELQGTRQIAVVEGANTVGTQLNALDADRDLFQAELALAQICLDESLTVAAPNVRRLRLTTGDALCL
jgi:hypothetical protein